MRKAEALDHWRNLPAGQDPLAVMAPIPYKATGSSYGACGVRIDGTPEFIDAVLSCLKSLLEGENCRTRLELSRQAVDGSKLGKTFAKAEEGAEVCYIRLHERGREAQVAEAIFGGARARQRQALADPDPQPVAPAAPAVAGELEPATGDNLPDDQGRVMAALQGNGAKACTDDLCNRTDLPARQVNAALGMLELAGKVRRYPGGLFSPA